MNTIPSTVNRHAFLRQKLVILLFFLITGGTLSAQELQTYTYYTGDILTLEYTYYLDNQGNWINHGSYTTYHYGTGQIQSRQIYEHGVKTVEETYGNGVLATEKHYANGELHGMDIVYYPSGYIYIAIQWANGRKVKETSYYAESDQVQSERHYGPDGDFDNSTSRLWYANGHLKQQFTRVNGELHGLYIDYREDGTTKDAWIYDHGNRIQWIRYNEYGNPIQETYADLSIETPSLNVLQRDRLVSYFDDGETIYREITGTYSSEGKELLKEYKEYAKDPHYYLQRHHFERWSSGLSANPFLVKTQSYYAANGQLLSEIPYSWEPGVRYREDGSYAGTFPQREGVSYTWNESGILTNETTWKDNLKSGMKNDYWDTGIISESATYAYDKLHGPYRKYDFEGRIVQEGNYSNGVKAGIWTSWLYANETIESEFDWGPGPPLIPPDGPPGPPDPEPDVEDPKILNKAISGKVLHVNGLPLADAQIRFGGIEVSSNSRGQFQIRVGNAESANLIVSKTGYKGASSLVDLKDRQSAIVNFKLSPEPASGKAIITQVKPDYEGIFLSGISLRNTYRSTAVWQERDPGTIAYQVNNTVFPVVDTGSGGAWTLDMGFDLTPSLNPKGNRIRVFCLPEEGWKPDNVVELNPIVVPTPPWSVNLGIFETSFDKGIFKYKLAAQFPTKPFEAQISQASMGTILWSAWSLIPVVGGSEFGIPPTQLGLEVIAQSDGAGSVGVTATTGFAAMGGTIEGTVGGKGKLRYDLAGQKGLVWEGTETTIGLAGTLKKEVGPVTLIPALSGAVNLPVIGRLMTWFNNTAKIDATLKVGGDVVVELVNKDQGITFKQSQGTLSSMLELGLGGDIKKIKARLSGKGETKLIWQFPANPGYLRQADATIGANLSLTIWSYTANLGHNHTFSTGVLSAVQGGANLSASLPGQPVSFNLIDTSYAQRPGYNTFAPRDQSGGGYRKLSNSMEDAPDDTLFIEQIHPFPEPAYAQRGSMEALAYVYMDPQKPVTQANEIYFSLFDGISWSEPAAVQTDTHNDYSPTLAFNSDGKLIAAWERVRPADFNGDSPDAIAPVMEIAYAVYDPGTGQWSSPVFLTDNSILDHSPQLLSATDGSLALVWESNDRGFLIGDDAHPSTLNYAFWESGDFSDPATVPGSFSQVLEFSAAYNGSDIRIVLEKDSDGNLADNQDTELFYLQGGTSAWTAPLQLTMDAVSDQHPQLVSTGSGAWKLLWHRSDELVELADWNGPVMRTVRSGSSSHAFGNFLLRRKGSDDLVAIWRGMDDLEHCLLYSIFNDTSGQWSGDLKLASRSSTIGSVDGGFPAEDKLRIFLARSSVDPDETHLYMVLHEFMPNASILPDTLSTDPANPELGDEIQLSVRVDNDGDTVLRDLSVSFYAGDPDAGGELIGEALVEPSELLPGHEGEAVFDSWKVPLDYDNSQIFAVIDPSDELVERDEADNLSSAYLVSPDTAVSSLRKEAQTSGKLDLIARVENRGNGIATEAAVQCRIDDREIGHVLIPKLMPGFAADVLFEVNPESDFGPGESTIFITVDPDQLLPDPDLSNNTLEVSHLSINNWDDDENGIPDIWQLEYFPNSNFQILDDPDNDGWNNRSEYQAGTSPLDAGDFPHVFVETTPVAGDLQSVLRWSTVADRTYKIQVSSDLIHWQDLSSEFTALEDGVYSQFDLVSADALELFYRLVIVKPLD